MEEGSNMKSNLIAICALMVMALSSATAQYAYFPDQGTITYEKTIHVRNLLKRHLSTLKEGDFSKTFIEQMASKVNETIALKKKLSFAGSELSFEPVQEKYDPAVENLLRMGLLDYQATVYQDLGQNVSKMSFEIGGSKIVIDDSLMHVKWKLTDEYREIAGYDCRRANGVVLDSVYVVAFYTDQIPLSGGPGTIHGLPGMILGFVVPEQHYNVYATKVEMNTASVKKVNVGRRDNPMRREKFAEEMRERFGQWMSPTQVNLLLAAMQL